MRLRRRIKVFPGVYLSFSNSGISTTIGVRGADVNLNALNEEKWSSYRAPDVKQNGTIQTDKAESLEREKLGTTDSHEPSSRRFLFNPRY
jgi:hypothetical protein